MAKRPAGTERPSPGVLNAPVTALPGIGPSLSGRLAERGLYTVEDVLWFVPRRYDDARSEISLRQALAETEDGARATCGGKVLSCRFHRRGRKRWIDMRLGDVDVPGPGEQASIIIIRWFNAHANMAAKFPKGALVVVSGRLLRRGMHAEMANPDVLSITLNDSSLAPAKSPIIPRYGDVPGVGAARITKACAKAVELVGPHVPRGAVPETLAARLDMVSLAEALRSLHRPPTDLAPETVEALNRGRSRWHYRLAFEDLFILGLAVALRRRARRVHDAVPCPSRPGAEQALAAAFPFVLTGAQQRAIAAISRDLARDVPMNRLLQGDVGSGKTAVAFAAAHQAVGAGRQVGFMAPTEILAEQHYLTLSRWCAACDIRSALLTASTPAPARREISRALESGELQLVVGTHALLSGDIHFRALGLVIIDEQHRFGVAQRVELREKAGAGGSDSAHESGFPHLLVMTATPIPRTLALTAYGDLDVTTIDEMPPGRMPVTTRVLSGSSGRERAHALVRRRLAAGEQVFVVCPLVESGDDEVRKDWADAVSTAARLASTFAPARVGLVHGRMSRAEREQVMNSFRAAEIDLLVATTVIEVGVDIPAATVMVVLDAHHFGLAQLHQLRGRVGRGGGEAHCLLMTRGRKTPEAAKRLEVMAATHDGFRIAEEDLKIRGPGELLGARQAGLPKLRFGDLREHADLLVKARQAAEELLDTDPDLSEHVHVARALRTRLRGAKIYGAESG